MHTEDEAKNMVCPIAMASGKILAPTSTVYQGQRCIGNFCMAWRWDNETIRCGTTSDPYGYCGLAGK